MIVIVEKEERKTIELCPIESNRFDTSSRRLTMEANMIEEVYTISARQGLKSRGEVLLFLINNYARDFVENYYVEDVSISIRRQLSNYLRDVVGDKSKDRLLKWFKESVIEELNKKNLFMIVSVELDEDKEEIYQEVEVFKTKQDAQVVLEALESVNRLNKKYRIEEVKYNEGTDRPDFDNTTRSD